MRSRVEDDRFFAACDDGRRLDRKQAIDEARSLSAKLSEADGTIASV